jgi:PAS domain S-box-containing protein
VAEKEHYLGATGLPLAGKISVILLIVGSLAALGLAWFGQDIVLHKFGETESELVLRNRHVLRKAIAADVDYVGTISLDWSQWNQLYDFAQGHAPEFGNEELNPEALDRLQLDIIQLLDPQGRVIQQEIRAGLHDAQENPLPDLGSEISAAVTGHGEAARRAHRVPPPVSAASSTGASRGTAPVAGWLNTSVGPMVVASRPILKSDASGPVAGSLIMARRLDPARLSAELSVLPSEVVVHGSGSEPIAPSLHEFARQLSQASGGAMLMLRDDDMSDFGFFRDINGRPAFLLETRMPRSILATGRETTHGLAVLLTGFGLLIFALLLVAIRFAVSRPLGRLASHMQLLRETGEFHPADGAQSGDEIGTLAQSFNELIVAREKTEQELRSLSAVAEHADEAIVILSSDGTVAWVNPAFERSRMLSCADIAGRRPNEVFKGRDDPAMYRSIWELARTGKAWKGRLRTELNDGRVVTEDVVVSPVLRNGEKVPASYVMLMHDVTARIALEAQLAQSQKLEAVAQLAAGVAHEVNTPAQYVDGNIRFLEEAFATLTEAIRKIAAQTDAADNGVVPAADLVRLLELSEIDYLQTEVPLAIRQTIEGVAHISSIVQSMKDLTKPAPDFVPANLNTIIESAVDVARNEWSDTAEIHLELDPDLPFVPCLPDSINQVVINLLANAADAIGENRTARGGSSGHVTIATRRVTAGVEIRVTDDGVGMTEAVQKRIFDPFFSTKPVGKGTGQGLAIVHSVLARHGGSISVDSTPGRGSCFSCRLPLTAGQQASGGHEHAELLGNTDRLAG